MKIFFLLVMLFSLLFSSNVDKDIKDFEDKCNSLEKKITMLENNLIITQEDIDFLDNSIKNYQEYIGKNMHFNDFNLEIAKQILPTIKMRIISNNKKSSYLQILEDLYKQSTVTCLSKYPTNDFIEKSKLIVLQNQELEMLIEEYKDILFKYKKSLFEDRNSLFEYKGE